MMTVAAKASSGQAITQIWRSRLKLVFGVEAASQYYFHKNVGQLNLEEMVRLVAVIPQPLKINPTENSDWLKWKSQWILDALRRYVYIDQMQYQSTYDRFQ